MRIIASRESSFLASDRNACCSKAREKKTRGRRREQKRKKTDFSTDSRGCDQRVNPPARPRIIFFTTSKSSMLDLYMHRSMYVSFLVDQIYVSSQIGEIRKENERFGLVP